MATQFGGGGGEEGKGGSRRSHFFCMLCCLYACVRAQMSCTYVLLITYILHYMRYAREDM